MATSEESCRHFENPHRPNKDIYMPDGRRLEFYSNTSLPKPASSKSVTSPWLARSDVFEVNLFNGYMHLAKRGVLSLPEIEATDVWGNPSRDSIALYVDSRIGKSKIWTILGVGRYVGQESIQSLVDTEIMPVAEIAALLDQGIEETGIGELLEQMRIEDAERAQSANEAPELDLNELMRGMRDQLH